MAVPGLIRRRTCSIAVATSCDSLAVHRESVDGFSGPGLDLEVGAEAGEVGQRVPADLVALGQPRGDFGCVGVVWIGPGEVDQVDVLVAG
jgi:hypothetical protein